MVTLPRWGDSFPTDALARIRDLEAELNSLIAEVAGAAANYWAYDGSTLSPDPATTTPLEIVNIVTNGGDAGVYAFVTPQLSGSGSGVGVGAVATGIGNAELALNAFSIPEYGLSATDGTGSVNLQGDGSGSFSLTADDGTPVSILGNDVSGQLSFSGQLGTDQTAAASVAVGTLAAKLPLYDNSGSLLGYIPVYNTIT